MHDFFISVIIPIYNTEKYLSLSIDSVISQDIGFRDHVQLILINDGSTDASEEICQEYKRRYPENIVYRYKENGGVGSARNMGLGLAEGEYVSFLDSDDMWSENAFSTIKKFLDESDKKTDVMETKICVQTGEKEDNHVLNWRFEKDRTVDLLKEPSYTQMTIGNCIFRRTAIGDTKFDEKMFVAEDGLFLNSILLNKPECGLICGTEYIYNKRIEGTSASQTVSKERFLQSNMFAKKIFAASELIYGEVLPFIQHVVFYEMKWYLCKYVPGLFSTEEAKEYKQGIINTLSQINDDVIYSEKKTMAVKKVLAYKLKYGEDIFRKADWENGKAFVKETRVFNATAANRCIIYDLKCEKGNLIISGVTDLQMLGVDFNLFAQDNYGKKYPVKMKRISSRDIVSFAGDTIMCAYRFILKLPMKAKNKYRMHVKIENNEPAKMKMKFYIFAKLSIDFKNSYCIMGDYIVKLINGQICIYDYSLKTHIASEARLIREMKKDPEYLPEYTKLRIAVAKKKKTKKKPIFILSDRDKAAGDNGSNLFKHAMTREESKNKDIYFLLSKDSKDYDEMQKYGPIIEPYSYEYKLKFLLSSKIISAHADVPVYNPFGAAGKFVKDLYDFDYIYLQHGILQGDLSGWLNCVVKNISMIPVSTEMEYNNLVSEKYGYSEKEIKKTGMTRFDPLNNKKNKKIIAFLPTWRAELAGKMIKGTREREYVIDFSETAYCRFYNELINDRKLIEAIEKNGYRGEFYVHPSFEKQTKDFKGNEIIKVCGAADYEKVLGESAVMVTDYSGVGFDFAYQRKPIVYAHFDDIYEGYGHHSYKDTYFDYEEQGFGPVAYNLEDTVANIIEILDNGCELSEKYRKRADSFFLFDDNRNSERVYNEILAMDEKEG